jgi:hypothetical protein
LGKTILEVLAVGIGACYTLAAFWQLGVMSDTLKLERPWVGTFQQKWHIDPNTKRMTSAIVHIRNGGRSPAINARWYLSFMVGPVTPPQPHWKLSDVPKAIPCEQELPGKGGNVFVPNGEAMLPVDIPADVRARLDEVYGGKIWLFVVGCIDYTDTSGGAKYRTNFLMKMEPDETGGMIRILDLGNDAN